MSFLQSTLYITLIVLTVFGSACADIKYTLQSPVDIPDKNTESLSLRVMTYNILYAPHPVDDYTENSWNKRFPKLMMIFEKYLPDIAGLQEPTATQISQLKTTLPQNYELQGVHPANNPGGIGLGILFNKDRIEQTSEVNRFWLKEEPNNPNSLAWDSSKIERFVIYASFCDKLSNKPFTFFVTHFDHLGKTARIESAKLLMKKVQELSGGNPVIVTGDFNTEQDECGEISYRNLTETFGEIRDIRAKAEVVLGRDGSWQGWSYDDSHANEGEEIRLDHIFLSKDISVNVTAVIDDQIRESYNGYESMAYPSDHLPILADLTL